jgi:hypothetical protein
VPLTVALENDAKVAAGQADYAKPDADEPKILKLLVGNVKCRKRLGGLLKHYYREAA